MNRRSIQKRDSLGMIDIERTHTMNLVATVHYLLEHDGKVLLNKNIATIGRENGEIEDYWDMLPIAIEDSYNKNFDAMLLELYSLN